MASNDISQIISAVGPAAPQSCVYGTSPIMQINECIETLPIDLTVDDLTEEQMDSINEKPSEETSENSREMDADKAFLDYVSTRSTPAAMVYRLRREQSHAVNKTLNYIRRHRNDMGSPAHEFRWNIKSRFGKALSALKLCQAMGAKNILIITDHLANGTSWYEDYIKFIGSGRNGYWFVSPVDGLVNETRCLNDKQYLKLLRNEPNSSKGLIILIDSHKFEETIHPVDGFSDIYYLINQTWDVLILDGVLGNQNELKTDDAYSDIKRKFTLCISDPPLKVATEKKLPEEALFNWTYVDEQNAKNNWSVDAKEPNPYGDLPRLNLITYETQSLIANKALSPTLSVDDSTNNLEKNIDLSLNELFSTTRVGSFQYDDKVSRFLDALTTKSNYPFSTPELRNQLNHSLWMLDNMDSARAMHEKLSNHPIFREYRVILVDDNEIHCRNTPEPSRNTIQDAVSKYDKTITLMGNPVTSNLDIPQWSAVFMLSDTKNPAQYMQAAFQAQNPCLYIAGEDDLLRKKNSYVFDFSPIRALTTVESFANNLYGAKTPAADTMDASEKNIHKLLNLMPVYGENDMGEITGLKAGQILDILRRSYACKVVKQGFMDDLLFQNVTNVFKNPVEVIKSTQPLEPSKLEESEPIAQIAVLEPKAEINMADIDATSTDERSTHKDAIIHKDQVIASPSGITTDTYEEFPAMQLESKARIDMKDQRNRQPFGTLIRTFKKRVVAPLLNMTFGKHESKPEQLHKDDSEYTNSFEVEKQRERTESDNKEIENILPDAFQKEASESASSNVARKTTLPDNSTEEQKTDSEDEARILLREFSKNVPWFLLAFGNHDTSLDNLETIVPSDVFEETMGITVEQFLLLRDGANYSDQQSNAMDGFEGHVFNERIFNDSIEEFVNLRDRLSNYLDEKQTETIFDYMPSRDNDEMVPPLNHVNDRIGALEKADPYCFDDPSHIFLDSSMTCGLYIAEIIKRLYGSEAMKLAFPNDRERLDHILEHQVYGIASNKIAYQIATGHILGFNDEIGQGCRTNFVIADTEELCKENKLGAFVERVFGLAPEEVKINVD